MERCAGSACWRNKGLGGGHSWGEKRRTQRQRPIGDVVTLRNAIRPATIAHIAFKSAADINVYRTI